MNVRCSFCQTPFTLSRVALLDALQEVNAGKLSHYDAQCPRCRRATPIPTQKLEMAMPNWKEELREFEKEMKKNPQQEAPLPEAESTTDTAGGSTSEATSPEKGKTKSNSAADAQKSNERRSASKGSPQEQ